MRPLPTLLLGVLLLTTPSCATRERAISDYPSAFAIIISANIVKYYEPDPTVYDGAKFPLFCGYAVIRPEENKFEFIQKTDLPIRWVKMHLEQLEKEGFFILYPAGLQKKIHIRDEDFSMKFYDWLGMHSIQAKSVALYKINEPEGEPQFTRMCPYDSEKDPPVECGGSLKDVHDLLVK